MRVGGGGDGSVRQIHPGGQDGAIAASEHVQRPAGLTRRCSEQLGLQQERDAAVTQGEGEPLRRELRGVVSQIGALGPGGGWRNGRE